MAVEETYHGIEDGKFSDFSVQDKIGSMRKELLYSVDEANLHIIDIIDT